RAAPGSGLAAKLGSRRMRLAPRPENATERLALLLNLAPVPVGRALFGMASARALLVAARIGVFAILARGAADPEAVAAATGITPAGARLLLEVLVVDGALARDGDRYALGQDARAWL